MNTIVGVISIIAGCVGPVTAKSLKVISLLDIKLRSILRKVVYTMLM